MRYLVHHLLEHSAQSAPDLVAVKDGDRTISYGALNARADRAANLLSGLGVQSGDRVGLYLDKSIESLVGIYAILKCGAAYVPFDPQAPAARLGYIARDCELRVLLTGSEKRTALLGLLDQAPNVRHVVVLNGGAELVADIDTGVKAWGSEELDVQPEDAPARPTIDQDLAYILYTSGSTGHPKGVMLSHRNALAFVDWAVDAFSVGPEDRLSSHAPLHFDLSVFDLYASAAVGAAVVLVPGTASVFPAEVARFIDNERISIWYSVPSILSMLALRGRLAAGCFPGLRRILFAGEVFPTKYLRKLMHQLPHVRFANLYGPTETNVCTAYEVTDIPDDDEAPVPIGQSIANDEVFAVGDDGARVGPGEVGELWVRGATVMHGYWGDPERTARTLIRRIDERGIPERIYRTGDLVRLEPDGNYRLLGRLDTQIKSRGYRIELGDVEAALYAHPSVEECAVTAVPDELVTNRIRAVVVTREAIDANALAKFCSERVPRYMVPEIFEFVDALPKTSTGKVDRQALTATDPRALVGRS